MPMPSFTWTGDLTSGCHAHVTDTSSTESFRLPISCRVFRKEGEQGWRRTPLLLLQELVWTLSPKSVTISSLLGSPLFPQRSLLSSRQGGDPHSSTFLAPQMPALIHALIHLIHHPGPAHSSEISYRSLGRGGY